ncbi:MAG TPA: BTAD domain-containing putative transcriptional regulator [Dongiaceae bacterium]|nr:BTAD domain-containing putative transcriptional regulator [Dongiaceae bacterium]
MLTAHLLGRLGLSDAKGRDVSPRSRKASGLLGYLLLSDPGIERREKLAGLLWSESSTDQAYDSLRHCLAELRRVEQGTGISFLDADRQNVRIDRSQVRCDVADLKAHLAAGRVADCRGLLELPDLTLMRGAEAGDPTFDNWLLVERERTAEMLVREMLVLLREDRINARDRMDLARAIQQLDPYQEDAVRVYMELLAAAGNVAGAAAFFERYRNRLLREYEVDPSEELLDFAEAISARASAASREPKAGSLQRVLPAQSPAPPPSAALAPSAGAGRGIPIIAVLSLRISSLSDQLQHLADAFLHELVSTLCRFKEWTVTAPGEEMEGKTQANSEIALGELAARGVDFALVTSVTSVAGATAINVRLVECDSRAVIISDQYPASPENWLAALNDICCRIASRTKISLIAARLRRVTGKSMEQMQAYDLWLEGEVLADLWERETEEKAIELFSRAVELDGNLAGAYAGWASVLNSRWIVYPGLPADEPNREQAYQLAKRAVALDPLNAQTQGNLGWSHILARRFEPAELHFGLAYDLNPSNPDNLIACALGNAFCGNHPRARELSRRALDLNPFPQPYYFGYRANIDFLGRDFRSCIEAVNRAPDLFPDIQAWAAAAYAHLGDTAAARAALDRYLVDIRKRWAGPANPSDGALCDWLVDIFPIRHDADRALLADGLRMIRLPAQRRRRS